MNNTLIIDDVTHDLVIPVIFICILSCICVYNIYCLIAQHFRSKKLRTAAGMIIDGHTNLTADKQEKKSDNGLLKESMVKDQIEKNRKKIEKIRKEVSLENEKAEKHKLREIKRQDKKAIKKEKAGNKEKQKNPDVEAMLNMLYQEDDFFDAVMTLYYQIKIPQISDPTVRERVMIKKDKSCKKHKSDKKSKRNALDENSNINEQNSELLNDIRIFD